MDVRLSVVLDGWRPLLHDTADGKQSVLVIVGTRKQPEGRAPPPLQRFKLAELRIALHRPHALPLILTSSDIQRIVVTNSSWYAHNLLNVLDTPTSGSGSGKTGGGNDDNSGMNQN